MIKRLILQLDEPIIDWNFSEKPLSGGADLKIFAVRAISKRSYRTES